MKHTKTNILTLLSVMLVVLSINISCSSEDSISNDDEVKYEVVVSWKKGSLTRAGETNSITAPAVPTITHVYVNATPKEGLSAEEYPNKNYWIAQKDGTDNDTEGYTQYHQDSFDDPVDRIKASNINNYTFTAKATWPEDWWTSTSFSEPWTTPIPTFGSKDYLLAEGESDVVIQAPHVLFTLRHQTALIRFFIKVSEKYAAVRTTKLTSLKIYKSTGVDEESGNAIYVEDNDYIVASVTPSDAEGSLVKSTITTTDAKLLEVHVNPESLDFQPTAVNPKLNILKIVAEYDIYDKTDATTRKGCKSSNTLTLKIGEGGLQKGKYYDVLITIDPAFLYVLSDNDEEPVIVLK